jgi:uncharacterized protein (DUF1778 family)
MSATEQATIRIHVSPDFRRLVDEAARALGMSRTDFVVDAVRGAAEGALLERTLVAVSPKTYAEFLAQLEAPSQPNDRLLKTMNSPAPWGNG